MVKKGGKKGSAGGGSKKGKGGKGKGKGRGKGGKGKGKRGSKSKGIGKGGIRVIQRHLDQTTKEFYLWQIQLLEEKVGRYQKQNDEMVVNQSLFQAKFDKCLAEKNDLIAYLKSEMNKKHEAYTDLREKYLTLTQVLDNEQEQCRKKMASLTKQADENQAQIVAENIALTSKIAALEEFRIKRFQLMTKLASLQNELDQKTKEFNDKIMTMEHKFLVSKHTLKSEMIEKVKSVAAEFRKHSERNLNVTMTRTIQENVRTNTQLAKLSDKTVTLIDENTKQAAEMNELKHQLYLSELEGKDFSKKFQSAMESLTMMKDKCEEQLKMINMMKETHDNCTGYAKENEALQEEIRELQEENSKLISENKYLNKTNLKLTVTDVIDKDQKEEMEQLFFNSVAAIREALNVMEQISAEAAEAIKQEYRRAPAKMHPTSQHQQPDIDTMCSSVEINGSKDDSEKFSFRDAENASEMLRQLKILSFGVSDDRPYRESILHSPFDTNMDSQHGHMSLMPDEDTIPENEFLAAGSEAATHKKVSISQRRLRMGMDYKHPQIEYQPDTSVEDFHRPGGVEMEKSSRKTSAIPRPGSEQQNTRDGEKPTSSDVERKETERNLDTRKPDHTIRAGSLEHEFVFKKLKEANAVYMEQREKILEGLVLIIKSATNLGIRGSIQSEPVRKTQRSISFAPKKEQEIPRPLLTPAPLRKSSASDRRSLQSQTSLGSKSRNMEEMINLCNALSFTLQKSKSKAASSNVSPRKIYTQEDMLEYMLLFLDSTAQMGPEVQEKQICNLWTYAKGEVPPKLYDARRSLKTSLKMPTIYKAGDLGFVPQPQPPLHKKLDRIRMDQERLRLSLRMDVATKSVATQTLVYTEQRVLHALSINAQQTAGLAKYKDGASVTGLSLPVPSRVMSKNLLKQSISYL